ncbi:MAG: hypothetical protein QNJ70_08240 [Xenococcaceae cyanobacterium MO_207.B15]|nr:hypothetical protein [Xenococcaceae cyanobacterium MO_207.B15]
MIKTIKAKNRFVPASVKFFLIPILMLGIAFEAIALAGCDNSTIKNTTAIENQTPDLPESVAQAVLSDLSKKTQISPNQLTITKARRELWSNGCLDLAQEDEFCTQALVPGWRVFVSGDDQTWVYHTDQQGRMLRVEP